MKSDTGPNTSRNISQTNKTSKNKKAIEKQPVVKPEKEKHDDSTLYSRLYGIFFFEFVLNID